MNSDKIFQYSTDFLNEIIESLIPLKILKKSNPKSSDFDNKIKGILGKDFLESDLKRLNECSDKELREILNIKFRQSRDERIKLLGEEQAKDIEKRIFLQSIDINWKSHIQYLEQLRQVIGLRSYGQRDPLVEYKKEAFYLFENLLNKLKLDFITILMNLKIVQEDQTNKDQLKENKINQENINKKIGRNEPCFCGSGKKYKRCCGAL
jgi:preprotein translocase subunit SecA